MAAGDSALQAKGSKRGAVRRKRSEHLCGRLGSAHPIFGFSHSVEVTAALAKTDCYPFIGLSQATPEEIPETLERVRAMVGDRPFGVDLLMPLSITGESDLASIEAGLPIGHKAFTRCSSWPNLGALTSRALAPSTTAVFSFMSIASFGTKENLP